jgi:hypothetical protein
MIDSIYIIYLIKEYLSIIFFTVIIFTIILKTIASKKVSKKRGKKKSLKGGGTYFNYMLSFFINDENKISPLESNF